ncbi:hypothetical protein G6710_02065 [Polynucleobacter paneuropaeus]|nr:hypothetical protein [Polynucleobacter paneuropaeus]
MKYIIIIPTYKDHLNQVDIFLESFSKFCIDAKEIGIRIIISKNEEYIFSDFKKKWSKRLNIEIISLNAILLKEEGINIDEDKLLEEVGKFNFQAIKKIYGGKYFDCEMSLVVDSEAVIIRVCSFQDLFEGFKVNKFIIYSRHESCEFHKIITRNCADMLGIPYEDKWMLEYQYWFFEKSLVEELFQHLLIKTKVSVLENFRSYVPVFDFNLYCLYLFYSKKNGYKFVDSDMLLKSCLGEKQFQIYKAKMISFGVTLFEYFPWAISSENIIGFKRLFDSLSMKFFKYDDRHQDLENIACQRKFIEEVNQIFMLPCRVVSNSFEFSGICIEKNHSLEKNYLLNLEIFKKLYRAVKKCIRS